MAIKKLSTLSGLVTYRSASGLYDYDLINISLSETPSVSTTSGDFSTEGWVSSKVTYGELSDEIEEGLVDSTFISGGFLDEDDMSSDSPSGIASQQSIKAYVDKYAFKFVDAEAHNGVSSTTYTPLDLSSIVGTNRAYVYLRVSHGSTLDRDIQFKTNDSSVTQASSITSPNGLQSSVLRQGESDNLSVITDEFGFVEWISTSTVTWVIVIEGYQVMRDDT